MLASPYQIYLFARLCMPKWHILNPIQDGSFWKRIEVVGRPPSKTCCTYSTKIKLITFHAKSAILDVLGCNDNTCTLQYILWFSSLLLFFFTIALVNMTLFLLMSLKLTTSGLLKITQNLRKMWQRHNFCWWRH